MSKPVYKKCNSCGVPFKIKTSQQSKSKEIILDYKYYSFCLKCSREIRRTSEDKNE